MSVKHCIDCDYPYIEIEDYFRHLKTCDYVATDKSKEQ